MNRNLLPHLVCPACLPVEIGLECHDAEAEGMEVTKARLNCRACGRDYWVDDGIADLLPERADPQKNLYERRQTVDSYLWSHYADLLDDPDAGNAYAVWADLLAPRAGLCLDIGCSVGRFTFEMAARHTMAIGIDTSRAFIREARRLLNERHHDFMLPIEGALSERLTFPLPKEWAKIQVEFIVADALALPFRQATFDCVSSLNILDKVPHPLDHLHQATRVAKPGNATLLVSDPFSWSDDVAPPQEWLGGRTQGPFSGRGLDNLRYLLTGPENTTAPWRIVREGSVWWKIRNHANHFELIRSEYLLACR